MTIIQNEYARGSIVFDADYRTGSIADKSPYKAAATPSGAISWTRTKQGHGIKLNGGTLTYADNLANRLADGEASFIIFGDLNLSSEFLLYKRNINIVSYQIYVNDPNILSIDFYDGTNIVSMISTTGLRNRKLITITLINGTAPKLYLDGSLAAIGNGILTIPSTNNTSELFICSNRTGGFSPRASTLSRITLLNHVLSPQEISQLYQELSAERYPLRAYSFGCRISAPKDPPGVSALLKTDFTTRLADGRLADLSGNGWHGTVKPGFVAGPGMCGNSLVANSASRTYVDFGEVPINGVSKLTIVHYGQRGASNPSEILFDKGTAANNRNEINASTTQITWNVGSGGTVYAASVNDANVNTSLFQTWSYDGNALANSDKVKVNLDGIKPSVTITANFPVTLPNTTGTPFTFGRLGWLANFPPPKQSDFFAAYLGALTHEQTEYIRKQITQRCTFQLDMQRTCVSLANLTGPCEIPGTPFRVLDGTWKIGEDASGKRWINSVATNNKHVYMPSTQVYGTWTCSVYHTTGDEYFAFASNCKDLSLASRNVYSILLTGTTLSLYRFGPSSSTVLMSSTLCVETGKKYKLAITRSGAGQFTVYIKGGAYLDWTKVTATTGANPVTDATYTASSNCVLSTSPGANGGGFADFAFFTGPFSLDMLKEHCP